MEPLLPKSRLLISRLQFKYRSKESEIKFKQVFLPKQNVESQETKLQPLRSSN